MNSDRLSKFYCERRLSCLNRHSTIHLRKLNELLQDQIECQIYEYLSCNYKLLDYLNITESDLTNKKPKVKNASFENNPSNKINSNSLVNEINYVWYDQDGRRIINDLKSTTTQIIAPSSHKNRKSIIALVNKLGNYRPTKYGNLTCVAQIQSNSLDKINAYYNWLNDLARDGNKTKISPSIVQSNFSQFTEKEAILSLLVDSYNDIVYEKELKYNSQNEVSCSIMLVENYSSFENIFSSFSSNYLKFVVILLVCFILFGLLVRKCLIFKNKENSIDEDKKLACPKFKTGTISETTHLKELNKSLLQSTQESSLNLNSNLDSSSQPISSKNSFFSSNIFSSSSSE